MFDPRALQPIRVIFPPCGVFVLESHHTRGFRMTPIRHDFLKVIQPFAGAGWLVRGATRVPLHPGDVVFVPIGESHHIEDDGARPLSLYALCVAAHVQATAPSSASFPKTFRHFPAPVWTAELRGLIRHLLHEQTLGRPGSDMMSLGLAWQALGHIARAASSKGHARAERVDQPARSRVAAYAEELKRTFYHRQTVNDAAAAQGMSRRHFTQLFREVTGQSWLTMMQQHRLTHARRLLRDSDRSVTSIGYECGFDDITTFYRAFKSAEGLSPLAWRNASGRNTERTAKKKTR